MSDITQKVTIMLGGDATQAKKVIAEVEQALAQSQRKMAQSQTQIGRNMGRDMGDQFGREFNRAQDKWLNAASAGFRRWGGTVGAIIAEAIGAFDTIDKIGNANERLERAEAKAAGGAASGATGNAVGSVVGDYYGSKAGSRAALGENRMLEIGILGLQPVEELSKTAAYRQRKQMERMRYYMKNSGGIYDHYLDKMPGGGKAYSDYEDLFDSVPGLRTAGQSRLGAMWGDLTQKLDLPKPLGMLDKLAKPIGGLAGISIGAIVGVFAAVVTGFKKLGEAYDEVNKKRESYTRNDITIKSIEEIGNASERTSAILKKFGENGQEAFRKLKEEQASLKEELAKSEGWDGMMMQGKLVTESLGEMFADMWGAVKKGGTLVLSGLGKITGTGITDEFAKENSDLVQKNIRDQDALDKKLAAKAKRDEKNNKEIAEYEKKQTELRKDLEKVKEADDGPEKRIDNLKKEIEAIKTIKDMIDSEKDRANYLDYENQLLTKQVELAKAQAEHAKDRAKSEKEFVEMIDEENKRIDDSKRKLADRDKFGVADLASAEGINSGVRNKAKEIQSLETNIKRANASGRSDLANQWRQRANALRNELGNAGVIQSDEFGDEYSVRPKLSFEQERQQRYKDMEDKRKADFANLPSQRFVMANGEKAKAFTLGTPRQLDDRNAQNNNTGQTIDGYFRQNGRLPVVLQSPE